MKTLILLACIVFCSCANDKIFIVNNKSVTVKPYGWANYEAIKNDSVVYQMSAGNVALSIVFCETIIVPVWLTGWQIYEPVEKKKSNCQ